MTTPDDNRLIEAERRGLRLAVFCRTLALFIGLVFWVGSGLAVGSSISPWAVSILSGMIGFGVLTYLLIGTRFDRWWLKYAIYAVDILAVCALFAIVPVTPGTGIPQIIAFRAYGIYYLFPLIALACLSLSWRLVLWSGTVTVAGWGVAYGYVISDMDRRLSWTDLRGTATKADYETIFLSIDFVGFSNRVVEAGTLFMASAILALAVYRARQVFFAQLSAEAARTKISNTLGRYVPEPVAKRLIEDEANLAPQDRYGVVLVMDVAGFTRFAESRPPSEVIDRLNGFLAQSASAVSENHGIVVHFTGDGLMATFNTPLELAAPERAALSAAQALSQVAERFDFKIRVGIAAGSLAAGSIGSSDRQAFTVYGQTVNRAARLEALGKSLGASILLDQACAEALGAGEGLKDTGTHRLAGFTEPVPVWSVEPNGGSAGTN